MSYLAIIAQHEKVDALNDQLIADLMQRVKDRDATIAELTQKYKDYKYAADNRIEELHEIVFDKNDYIAKLEMEAEQNSVLIVALQDTIKAMEVEEVEVIPEGWHIEIDRKPIRGFDLDYWHDDYDGENGLCGTAATREHAIQYILEGDWDL